MNPTPPVRPKLIATDLDGTLLRGDKTVSSRTQEALRAAEQAGLDVVFVTGRPARWMRAVVGSLTASSVAICANGATVVDLRDELRLLDVRELSRTGALAVVAALRAAVPETTFAVERTSGIHYDPHYPPFFPDTASAVAPVEKLLAPPPAYPGEPIVKLLAHHTALDPDDYLGLARRAAGAHAEFTRSGPSALLEISAPGVSKASALARLCARRGIHPQEVIAFGDMPNDLQMLRWAGAGYAMANAHPAVRAAASRATASNEDDGVARVLEAVLA